MGCFAFVQRVCSSAFGVCVCVQAHPFFRALNLKALLLGKLEAPFVPELSSDAPELDVSNFDTKWIDHTPSNRCRCFRPILLHPPHHPYESSTCLFWDSLSLCASDMRFVVCRYTLEAPCLSPLRKPLSEGMEQQFEALALEYMSPETRNSLRVSRVSCSSAGSRGSGMSTSSVSGGGEAMLRFLPRPGG